MFAVFIKYVNMTDPKNPHLFLTENTLRETIELLYFSYRDFTQVADNILGAYGFGRAHHRVLYFVGRYPERSVGSLLKLLRITKQSLSRVLKELIDQGFIAQRQDLEDKRIKILTLTDQGHILEKKLSNAQKELIEKAFFLSEPDGVYHFHSILLGLIQNEADRKLFKNPDPQYIAKTC